MKLAYAFCGSFCTHSRALTQLKLLCGEHEVYPILSEITAVTDTRFGKAADLRGTVEELSGHAPILTVKEAEEGTSTVLRFYESANKKTKAQITLGFKAKKCIVCDMLENEKEELPITDGKVNVSLRGYEIVTLKVV